MKTKKIKKGSIKKILRSCKPVKDKKSTKLVGAIKMTTVFMNGKTEAVRLPKEFRLGTKKVYIKKSGNCLILIPIDDPWQSLINAVGKFSDDFMKNGRELLPDQEREDMFP